MKRLLVLVEAMVFVCLLMSACKAGIEIEETESAEDGNGNQGQKVSSKGNGTDEIGSVPKLENGYLRMEVHKKSEESADVCCVYLGVAEDSEEAWEKIEAYSQFKRKKEIVVADNVYLKIPIDRINCEYLAWMKKSDLEQYQNIKSTGFMDACITVIGSDDFKGIQMMYATCSDSDDFTYLGKYSVYNYKAGDTLSIEKREMILDAGQGKKIKEDQFMWTIEEVGYTCPWYLNRKNGTEDIMIGMNMELFQKYFEGQCENIGDNRFSYYVLQAKKGKRDELMQIVYQYLPDAWITTGEVYYQ